MHRSPNSSGWDFSNIFRSVEVSQIRCFLAFFGKSFIPVLSYHFTWASALLVEDAKGTESDFQKPLLLSTGSNREAVCWPSVGRTKHRSKIDDGYVKQRSLSPVTLAQ